MTCAYCNKRLDLSQIEVSVRTRGIIFVKCPECGQILRIRYMKNKVRVAWYSDDQRSIQLVDLTKGVE